MTKHATLALPGRLTIAGLLIAATGISTLFLTNSVDVPPVPMGPMLLVLAAGLVGIGPWRWTPIVANALALSILAGAFIWPGLLDRLSNPGQVGGFTGTWLQLIGLVTAIVAGTIATMENYATQTSVSNR